MCVSQHPSLTSDEAAMPACLPGLTLTISSSSALTPSATVRLSSSSLTCVGRLATSCSSAAICSPLTACESSAEMDEGPGRASHGRLTFRVAASISFSSLAAFLAAFCARPMDAQTCIRQD